jgi:penicillin amidase
VVLSRDRFGVVSISAADRSDAIRALGFVHAQERYFEMDLARRQAAGELAALFGAAALPLDLNLRRHRFRKRALTVLAQIPKAQRSLLDGYVAGVNAGLNALSARPWTYFILGQQPTPWRAEDSVLVGISMFIGLDDAEGKRERELGTMAAAMSPTLLAFLLRGGTRWDAPLTGFALPDPPIPDASVIDLRTLDRNLFKEPIKPPSGLAEGSNQFAVSGSLATGGAALVANDMHLGLGVPNIWFRAQWAYPDADMPSGTRRIAGATLPGVPGLIVGSNGQIAWGFTNAYGDWMDRVALVMDPTDPLRYQHAEGYGYLRRYQEVIEVAGATAHTLEVLESAYGPVLGTDEQGRPLTQMWTAHLPDAVSFNALELEQAADLQSALQIAHRSGTPPLNFMVGDQRGRIAWTIAGSIPKRLCQPSVDCSVPGQAHDWRLPIASTRVAERIWDGLQAPADVPVLLDPADGRLWTANARVVAGAALQMLGDGGYDLGARAGQIRDALRARERFVEADLLALQLDDRALFLEPWRGLLLDVLRSQPSGPRDALLAQLEQWNGHASTDSVAYRIVRSYRMQVHARVLTALAAPLRQNNPAFAWPKLGQTEGVVWQLLEARPMHLLDPNFHSWDALLLDCADRVAENLSTQPGGLAARTWGEANTTAIAHPLSRALPWLSRWLNMPAQALPGDAHMPRVQTPRFGASQRMVVAPGQEQNGIFHMPGGQSGHPLSPYYGAGHRQWADGSSTPLLAGSAEHTLYLEP